MKPTNTRTHSKKNVAFKKDFTQHSSFMTEQFIAPPARVWEKIERILDEQDRQKRAAASLQSFSRNMSRKRMPIFAAAAASVIAGVMWLYK